MRKANQAKVEVLSGGNPYDEGSVEEVKLDPNASSYEAGSAVTEEDLEAAKNAPKLLWYRVLVGGNVLENGFRTRMKEGKEINSFNYNIRRLQQQGIKLQAFDPDILEEDQVFA